MERMLLARIGACRLALADLSGESHAAVSRTQALAVKEIAGRDVGLSSLSAESRAKVLDLALQCAWHPDDKAMILPLLSAAPAEKRSRRPMQHFCPALLSFFTSDEWDILATPGFLQERLDLILRRVGELSGRNLAEPSLKVICSLCMLLEDEGAARYPTAQKRSYFDALKKEFKRRSRNLGAPSDYIVTLPPYPSALARTNPTIYNLAFPNGAPVACRVQLSKLLAIDNSYGCRGSDTVHIKGSPGNAPADGSFGTKYLLDQMMAIQEHHLALLKSRDLSAPANAKVRSLASLAHGDVPVPMGDKILALCPPAPQEEESQSSLASDSPPASSSHGSPPRPAGPEAAPQISQSQQTPPAAPTATPQFIQGQLHAIALPQSSPPRPEAPAATPQLSQIQLCATTSPTMVPTESASKGSPVSIVLPTDNVGSSSSAKNKSALQILSEFTSMHGARAAKKKAIPNKEDDIGKSPAPSGGSPFEVADSQKMNGAIAKRSQKAKAKPGQPERAATSKAIVATNVLKRPAGNVQRVDHERSRSQFLVRTGGVGAGSSKRFAYKMGDPKSQADAEAAARAFLEECKAA